MSAATAALPIAVVGAGIGGLCAAVALRRQGRAVRVYEQSATLGEVGAGLSLSPNAVHGLDALGVGAAVRARACEPPQQLTCHFRTGRTLLAIDRSDTVARYGAPYLQMHRGDLHATLLEALAAATPRGEPAIATGHRLDSVRVADAAVELQFSDGHTEQAALLVGADGWRSAVRAAVFGTDAPGYAGYVAWRALVPTTALRGLPMTPGSAVSIGPGRSFVRYPVRGGALINWVAFARRPEPVAESWTQQGTVDDAAAALHDFHEEAQALMRATPGGRCGLWGLYAREPLPAWCTDRVALLGDAAHPMLPWFGQGAGCAIEDGVVLARCLAASADPAAALRRYQAARLPRVTTIFRESLLGGERLAGADPDSLSSATVRNEDTLGIFRYDPGRAPI
jgi:salicylate hydroxylase